MGNSLRCCLACVLPFGPLDVVRIVHLDGRVDEYARKVTAGEVLVANPGHVLSNPCTQAVGRQRMIVSPECELKRGSIYFLIPSAPLPQRKKKGRRKVCREKVEDEKKRGHKEADCDVYTAEILCDKESGNRRSRGCERVVVWRPNLGSISEDS
ncbi:hypothetical protein HPP92_003688 [Vanilla planifolia]|uniref:Uncharacterized protein n=1 Tax=Vanilla planifolia TaxID=51239 RepID=A0A835VHG0_VANPL|nr:hypothetical protein HPP92_003688 [Vanilla planifolia]